MYTHFEPLRGHLIIRLIKGRRMSCAVHVARMEKINAYGVLLVNPERKTFRLTWTPMVEQYLLLKRVINKYDGRSAFIWLRTETSGGTS